VWMAVGRLDRGGEAEECGAEDCLFRRGVSLV
jgi:hypothetical protein